MTPSRFSWGLPPNLKSTGTPSWSSNTHSRADSRMPREAGIASMCVHTHRATLEHMHKFSNTVHELPHVLAKPNVPYTLWAGIQLILITNIYYIVIQKLIIFQLKLYMCMFTVKLYMRGMLAKLRMADSDVIERSQLHLCFFVFFLAPSCQDAHGECHEVDISTC